MRIINQRYQPKFRPDSLQWRRLLIFSVLITFILALVPWTLLLSPEALAGLALLTMVGVNIWLQWRVNRLQTTVNRLSHQVRRLSSQSSATSKLSPRSVTHIETKQFFNGNQTKH